MNKKANLEQLRQKIDECDEALISILKQRQSYVDQLVESKRAMGEPLYVPEREQAIFQKARDLAAKSNVCPHLIQDLLQRIMRDSYQRQAQVEYPCATQQPRSVCIIGGGGQLGQFFATQFKRSGHRVAVVERHNWDEADSLFANADLVLVAVPIADTEQVIKRLDKLPTECVLADITSIKQQPLQQMLHIHQGPVVGFHPMFGPGLSHLARQLILFCDGRHADAYAWVIRQFELWGCHVRRVVADEHDKVMSMVQALRHFNTFIAGWQLMDSKADIAQLVAMSSPIYRMELALIGRLFAQNPELYVDILLQAKDGIAILDHYHTLYQQALAWLQNQDRQQLIDQFKKIADYFGSWKEDFFYQSDTLLEAFRERL
jgi:chorismate mutase/prephenate dehydrogenase